MRSIGGSFAGEALAILGEIASAIDAAHRKQLIHRDLKPENVVLASAGPRRTAKVLDFGVAKSLATGPGATFETRAGLVAGTPAYMAPEQLQGNEPCGAWDIWALAVIGYEMVAGVRPLGGTFSWMPNEPTREVALTPLEARLGEPGDTLAEMFAGALSPDPAKRPASAAQLVAWLEQAAPGATRAV